MSELHVSALPTQTINPNDDSWTNQTNHDMSGGQWTLLTDDQSAHTGSGCHCSHQEHWAKELLRVALRIEQRMSKFSTTPNNLSESVCDESEEKFDFAATNGDEIERLFLDFIEDDDKKNCFITKARKEVSKNRKKSIERILLTLAPPSAWKEYSKLGQRGKRSATSLGVNKFLVSCLSKVSLFVIYSSISIWLMMMI